MPLGEFQLIERFFRKAGQVRGDVVVGVGDDCAVLSPPPGRCLAVTADTLVEGVHFLPGVAPGSLGHKALAVNLSDLAAMGAEPAWATLALTVPAVDENWLGAFSRGFAALAEEHRVSLVGGDTTRGPLAITVQLLGFVEPAGGLLRRNARPGDLIYVTGTLGDACLGLRARQGLGVAPADQGYLWSRLETPTPRVREGLSLAGLANAAIDVSDGLAGDLMHILNASGVGATLLLDRLPMSSAVRRHIESSGDWDAVLAGGDDYELCFTVPPQRRAELESAAADWSCALTRIGVVEEQRGLRCILGDGNRLAALPKGYEHFV